LDPEGKVWHVPDGASTEAFVRWACSQERKFLHVPSGQEEQARQAGACQDADSKAWYAPIGSTPNQLAAMSDWAKELERVKADAVAPKTADQVRAEQRAQVERAIAEGELGDWKRPVPLKSLPDRFFNRDGQVEALYMGSRVSKATGQEFLVMKATIAGETVHFGSMVGTHEIKNDIRQLDAETLKNRAHTLWIKREPNGALGWVEVQGRAIAPSEEARRQALEGSLAPASERSIFAVKAAPEATVEPQSHEPEKTGILAKAVSAVAGLGAAVTKAAGLESQEAIQARLRAQGEAVLKDRAAREAALAAKAELDRGRDIIDAVHGAEQNLRRDRATAGRYWSEAVEKIARGGFDAHAQFAGSTLVHHMAKVAPHMETVLLANGKTMDAQSAFAVVAARAGGKAMSLANANGETPEKLLEQSRQSAAEDQAKWVENLKGIDAGLSPRKPIEAAAIPEGKVLDGVVLKVDHETLIFQAKEGRNTFFYELPRVGLFGNREEFGLEVGAKGQPMKIQIKEGAAKRAFILNPAAKEDATAPKELAVARAAQGRFHIEGSGDTVSRSEVLARTSSAERERQRQHQLAQKRVASQGRGAQSI
jgi:hypothetical protein